MQLSYPRFHQQITACTNLSCSLSLTQPFTTTGDCSSLRARLVLPNLSQQPATALLCEPPVVARLVLPNLSQQPATALLCEPPVNSRIIFKFSHTNYSPVTTGQPAYLCTLLHHDTLRSTNQFFPRCTSIFR